MSRWRRHLAENALGPRAAALMLCALVAACAGCPAPYPGVPHQELAERILEPPLPAYQLPPSGIPGAGVDAAENAKPQTNLAAQVRNPRAEPGAKSAIHGQQVVQASATVESDPSPGFVRRLNYSQAETLAAPLDSLPPPTTLGTAELDVVHAKPQADLMSQVRDPRAEPGAKPFAANSITTAPVGTVDDNALTLAAAIDLAYRNNPQIQQSHARLNMARAGKDVAYADFLPEVDGGYRFIDGQTNPTHGFVLPTVVSAIGNVAFGTAADEVGMAELRAQWTLWDFGRTTSKFGQSLVAEQIAGLQYVRTQQTVAFDVTKAYFDSLDANATLAVAEEAVRRAQSALDDAKHYFQRGNAIRNDVLRADVFVKDMQLELVKAKTAQGVALAKLNQTIGMNSADAPRLVELAEPPRFEKSLRECLECAVENRREFGVVEHGIAQAKLGENIAEAEFMPKVIVGGLGALEAQRDTSKDVQHASAGIAIELGLYQGGRRVGELRRSSAEIDLAVASGKQVCDQIAYEVRVAYLAIDDARERIEVSRVAAAQASENVRVLKSQFDQGDAIPTDIIEAELALIRAQQGYLIATYDYETALARVAYAVGLPPESYLAMSLRR